MNQQELKEVDQDFTEIEETEKDFHIWSIKEILSHDFGKEEWLVEPLIPLQTITALSGDPGSFKTWLTLELAKCVALGVPFLGHFPTRQGSVLIIDEENHLRHIKKRLQQLQLPKDIAIFYISQNEIKIDNLKDLKKILRIVKEKQILSVIVDSLIRIHSGDENDARTMADVLSRLKKIIGVGANVVFTHHHRKESSYGPKNPSLSLRGSSDILAIIDCHLSVEELKNKNKLVIRQTKLRQGEQVKPFAIKIQKASGNIEFQYEGGYADALTRREQSKEAILQILKDETKLSRKDIIARLEKDFGGNLVGKALEELKESGEIDQVPRPELSPEERKQNFYRLPK